MEVVGAQIELHCNPCVYSHSKQEWQLLLAYIRLEYPIFFILYDRSVVAFSSSHSPFCVLITIPKMNEQQKIFSDLVASSLGGDVIPIICGESSND